MSNRNKKMVVIATSVAIVGIYSLGCLAYNDKIGPRTFINDVNVSRLKEYEVQDVVFMEDSWSGINIKNSGESLIEILDSDIKYRITDNTEVSNILSGSNAILWPLGYMSKKEYDINPEFEYDKDELYKVITNSDILEKDSKDAYIAYSVDKESFFIEPHVSKINLSAEEFVSFIVESIDNKSENLDIKDYMIDPEIKKDNPSLVSAVDVANSYLDVEVEVKVGDNSEIIDKDLITEWIEFDGLEAVFNKELIREYVIDNLSKYDTYGEVREFKSTSGEIKYISDGSYGWLTHRADTVDRIVSALESKESSVIEPVFSYSAVTRGKDDIGTSYIEIDIDNQMVYLYSKGELKVETKTVTGNPSRGFGTPRNRVDPVNYKTTNAVLRGEGYASPVKYWIPFNMDVGLHDASWQESFGGEVYKSRGSRGCINLPLSSAEEIYKLTFEGMPVIVYWQLIYY